MKSATLIGFSVSLGANLKGSERTPTVLRNSNIMERMRKMGVTPHYGGEIGINWNDPHNEKYDPHAKGIYPVLGACRKVTTEVEKAIAAKSFPVVVGGDHTSSIGAIAGLARAKKQKCGVIYFDAHGDFNTPETTPSGNLHGMTLGFTAGRFPERYYKEFKVRQAFADPKKTVIIGARSIDVKERLALESAGVRIFTMREIDARGISGVTYDAVKIASAGGAPVHLSIDMDVLDPAFAPGVNTPVIGGLSYRELLTAVEQIREIKNLGSADVAEANLSLDKAHVTLDTLTEIILDILGKDPYSSLL